MTICFQLSVKAMIDITCNSAKVYFFRLLLVEKRYFLVSL